MSGITSAVYSIEEYFAVGAFAPANIQRDYQWTSEQVGALVQDLVSFADANAEPPVSSLYFLGTLIGLETGGQIRLYDGLQRTTTLSLLMAFLRDRVKDDALVRRLHACLETPTGTGRLTLPPPDQTFAVSIAPQGATLSGIKGGFHGRRIALRRNLNAIRDHLDGRPVEWLERFAGLVLERTRVVLIGLTQSQLAEKVFETVNMRGLAIRPHDLIKSRLAQLAGDDHEAEEIVSGWDRVRQNVAQDFEVFVASTTDRLLAYPDISRTDLMQHLSDWLAAESTASPSGGRRFVEQADALTFAWNRVTSCTDGWTQAKEMTPLLPVWVFGWTEWIPLAVELTRRSLHREVPPKQLPEDLDELQRFCLMLELSEMSETGRRSVCRQTLLQIMKRPITLEQVLASGRIDLASRVHRTLTRPLEDYRLRRSLMLWIESHGRGFNLNVLRFGAENQANAFDPAQVEHVLPRNPAPESSWYTQFPDAADRTRLTQLIGNLIVVPKSVNEELGRRDFKHKRKVLQKHQGQLKPFATAQDALKSAEWTAKTIRDRTDRMIKSLCTDLRIPFPAIGEGEF